jgi:hypothetical protein
MESIPISMLVAEKLQAPADTHDRGHKARNRSAPAFNYFKRRFVALARHMFCAAASNNVDRKKIVDNAS